VQRLLRKDNRNKGGPKMNFTVVLFYPCIKGGTPRCSRRRLAPAGWDRNIYRDRGWGPEL
jgi:hypothetical protein